MLEALVSITLGMANRGKTTLRSHLSLCITITGVSITGRVSLCPSSRTEVTLLAKHNSTDVPGSQIEAGD